MTRLLRPALILSPLEMTFAFKRSRRRRGRIVETFRPLADDAAADESLQRAQFVPVLRRDKADGVAHRVRPAGAADAMDIIFRVHREIVIHHMRNTVHVNAARRDVRRHQHAHRAGLEIFQPS